MIQRVFVPNEGMLMIWKEGKIIKRDKQTTLSTQTENLMQIYTKNQRNSGMIWNISIKLKYMKAYCFTFH